MTEPADPVSALDEAAIIHHEMVASYLRAGFSRAEALDITTRILIAQMTAEDEPD